MIPLGNVRSNIEKAGSYAFCNATIRTHTTITIPNTELPSDLKKIAEVIVAERTLVTTGAVIYPILSALSGFPLYFYTPICTSAHYIKIRAAYNAGKQFFRIPGISDEFLSSPEIRQRIQDKEFSRFHIALSGDLVLHPKNHPGHFADLRGISFEDSLLTSLFKRFSQYFLSDRKKEPGLHGKISYFHMEKTIQNQIDKVLIGRQFRFRTAVGAGGAAAICAGGMLTSSAIPVLSSVIPVAAISVGMPIAISMTLSGSSDYAVTKQTDAVWKLLKNRPSFMEAIQPSYRNLYENREDGQKYVYISRLGDIVFSEKPPFSLRRQGKIQLSPRSG